MRSEDVQRIFNCTDSIKIGDGANVTIKDFLEIAGFKDAPNNPSKDDLHAVDQGIKGYADLIESGNYD